MNLNRARGMLLLVTVGATSCVGGASIQADAGGAEAGTTGTSVLPGGADVAGVDDGGVDASGSGGAAGTAGTDATADNAGSSGATATGGNMGTADASPQPNGGSPLCPRCAALFDGTSLDGWIQVPAASWTIASGAMHSLGTARGFIYTKKSYSDFRLIFRSRLIADAKNHAPCVLFWGQDIHKDALAALQVQPPSGSMWDYRLGVPTANTDPKALEEPLPHPNFDRKSWSQCEMLANAKAGTMRVACCQPGSQASCKAVEVMDFRDPTAARDAPLAFQVHNAAMIEEFKDVYIESPVAEPELLLTTR